MQRFDIKDKGDLKNFLGLEVDYDREEGVSKLKQKRYIQSILRRFSFENSRPCSTPIEIKLKLNESEKEDGTDKPVRELIGCLIYLMFGSRPGLSFAINFLSRYQDKYPSQVWIHLKRILKYVKATSDLSLNYVRKEQDHPLICYVDADWGLMLMINAIQRLDTL